MLELFIHKLYGVVPIIHIVDVTIVELFRLDQAVCVIAVVESFDCLALFVRNAELR